MIPQRFRANCVDCGMELDIRRPGVYAHTSGWVKNRSQGGGNAIALPVKSGSYACESCIDLASHPGKDLQAALF